MQAIYYGQVEIIPGVVCDGYVLTDGSAVMSERGTADLLNMDHRALTHVINHGLSKNLESFIDKDFSRGKKFPSQKMESFKNPQKAMETNCPPKSLEPLPQRGGAMETNCPQKSINILRNQNGILGSNLVQVVARNSPYCGRKIVVYTSEAIETLIRAYALGFVHEELRQNQMHIGKRAVLLAISLIRTALEAAIQEACGRKPQIQKLAQKNYVDAIQVVRDFGLVCRLPGVATKAEISAFLKTPMGTLNYFLRNNQDEIQPLLLTPEQIHALGRKTSRLYGYQEEDVVKMVLGMDTEIGIDIKRRMLGEMGVFFKSQAKSEVLWRKELAKAFEDDGLYYNYPVGKYRVDFFIRAFNVCLECNGYSHRHYDQEKEKERERFILQNHALIRFYPKADLSLLFRSILHCQPGQLIHLDPVSETV